MPTCTRASLVDGARCFKNYDSAHRTSILIYFNALELAAVGGTNYTIGHAGTLQAASVCLRDGLELRLCPPSVYDLVVAFNNAVAAGASPAETNAALSTAIACNVDFETADKSAQLLLLSCELGFHTGD